MRNLFVLYVIAASFTFSFGQNSKFEYTGRTNPSIKKEQLSQVKTIRDLSSEFWRKMNMPYEEKMDLEFISKQHARSGSYFFPTPENSLPPENHSELVDLVSIEVSAKIKGQKLSAISTNEVLTPQQLAIIQQIDYGADIFVNVKFKFKEQNYVEVDKGVIDGELSIAVLPNVEAEYPGGYASLSQYFDSKIWSDILVMNKTEAVGSGLVKFIINEDGMVIDTQMARTTSNSKIDQLILNATKSMPQWKPATDAFGKRVKQEIQIPIGNVNGC